jgi:hypothetical protein
MDLMGQRVRVTEDLAPLGLKGYIGTVCDHTTIDGVMVQFKFCRTFVPHSKFELILDRAPVCGDRVTKTWTMVYDIIPDDVIGVVKSITDGVVIYGNSSENHFRDLVVLVPYHNVAAPITARTRFDIIEDM